MGIRTNGTVTIALNCHLQSCFSRPCFNLSCDRWNGPASEILGAPSLLPLMTRNMQRPNYSLLRWHRRPGLQPLGILMSATASLFSYKQFFRDPFLSICEYSDCRTDKSAACTNCVHWFHEQLGGVDVVQGDINLYWLICYLFIYYFLQFD